LQESFTGHKLYTDKLQSHVFEAFVYIWSLWSSFGQRFGHLNVLDCTIECIP